MKIIIGSVDSYLSDNLRRLVQQENLFAIATNKVERILSELKLVDRVVILDIAWKDLQAQGVLRQIMNLARIGGSVVVCICPNQDESLKKLARSIRPNHVFIRYDLETTFRAFLKDIYLGSQD